MEKIIEVNKVSKSFKVSETKISGSFVSRLFRKTYYKQALNSASFSVNEGEIVALLGRNGSGKSTIIKIMTGILYPDRGSASVLGLDPWKKRIKLASQIGVVLGAHGQLYWNLPAMDTFKFMRAIYHIPQKEFKERLDYFVDMLSLNKVYKRQVRTLSLGEQMKCNFVASMLHMPKLVFLDEPTIGVDLPSKAALRQLILTMQKEHNTTFFITTHLVEDISMAEHIILLNKGKVMFDDSRNKLEHLFGNKRRIDLHLHQGSGLNFKKYGNIIEQSENFVRLDVTQKTLKSRGFIGLLSSSYISDYKVYEPGLNYILTRLYKNAEKSR